MYISASLRETKLAVVEDDQLVEVYFERDTDVGLVGGIYKGRVSRVLPGMQSAFVDIGLDRDAFLYVSDFFEDQEDYDKVLEEAEAKAISFDAESAQVASAATPAAESETQEAPPQVPAASTATAQIAAAQPAESPATDTPAVPAAGVAPGSPAPSGEAHEPTPFEPRGRRWRHRGRKFGEHRHAEHRFVPRQDGPAPPAFEILPGESLAKYSHAMPAPHDTVSAEAEDGEVLEQAEGGNIAEIAAEESATTELALTEAGVASGDRPEAEVSPQTPATPDLSPIWAVSPPAPEGSEEVVATDSSSAVVAPSPAPLEPVEDVAPALEAAGATAAGSATAEVVPAAASVDAGPSTEAGTVGIGEERAGLGPSEPSIGSEVQPVEAEDATDPGGTAEEMRASMDASPATVAEPQEEIEAESVSPTSEAAEGVTETPATSGQETQVTQDPAIESAGAENPAAPKEGTYTLREPHQRPRFAPRRGRRGRRGPGYQGRGESQWESRPGNNQPVQISKLLKEGQEILVQISKEPLGTKGARITSHIALPGRYLVYMPTVEHIGVSRKISSEEERLRLRNIVLENKGSLTGGFIVRTAGQGRDEEELKADLKFLSTLWNEIKSRTERAKAPALIHRDLDLVQRMLRDTLTPDFKSVRVDNEVQYERVLDFVNRSQPSLVGKVKLYSRETPIFEEFGIQAEIEKALKPKVWLKSGGYIVINQTEALVAIDVNTGKYVGKTNRLEDTILKTNFEAVNEIVRQLRLRDLGGIIVVDFIDMDERKNRAKVTQVLEEALRKDRAPTKVIAFHDFGLVAITRKRVKQSLERTLCERCTYCSGSGWVKSPTTVSYEILAEARKMAGQIEGKVMTLRVNPEVAKVLKSRDGALLSELESLTHKDVIVKSDAAVQQERFEIF
jgi:ribonuclease G